MAGYDTEMFGAHYKTLYWADAPVSDERLMEEHRFIYQSQFSLERYARYVRIPRDPLAGPPCKSRGTSEKGAGMKILAVESSCDETAVAVVEDGRRVLSDAIASQVDIHALYGGVVPEIASRKHVEVIAALAEQALREAGCTRKDIDAVAVTYAPGLIGAGAGGTQLCQVPGLCAGGTADPGSSCAGTYCGQLSGVSGAGAAVSGVGNLRRQYADCGCAGLHGYGDSGCYPG